MPITMKIICCHRKRLSYELKRWKMRRVLNIINVVNNNELDILYLPCRTNRHALLGIGTLFDRINNSHVLIEE